MITNAARPVFLTESPAPTAAPHEISKNLNFSLNQAAEMERLRACLAGEFFFFIEHDGTVSNAQGVQKWLGYSDARFTSGDFDMAIHASHAAFFGAFSATFFELIGSGESSDFLTPRLVASVALKSRNGQRYLFKSTTSQWFLAEKGKPAAFLREFEMIGPHRGEPLGPRLSMVGRSAPDFLFFQKMQDAARSKLLKKLPFTIRQRELLRLLVEDGSLREQDLAQKMGISQQTVHVHARMILPVAAAFFDQKFGSLKGLAEWLRDCGGI